MFRRDYGDYRWAMTQLFVQVDPWGHVSGGAPDDDYEREISELLQWRTTVTPEAVRGLLGEVSDDVVAQLVEGIADLRREFGFEPTR